MAQFKVGGKVVCMVTGDCTVQPNNEKFHFERGETRTITEIHQCICGHIMLSFGQKSIHWKPGKHSTVCECGIDTVHDTLFVYARYFAPIEEQEYKQVSYTKIIDEIPACAQ